MKFSTPAVAAGLALASAACTVTVDSHSEIVRQEKRFTLEGRADVRVTTFDGSIEIQSWDKPDVVIEVEKRGPTKAALEELQIVSAQNGNIIELEVKKPREESFRGIGLHRTAYARLIVNVPRETDVRAKSGDGSIRIERINGKIDLRTGDGSIRASDVKGELTLDTGDGSITVDDAEGRLTLDTADGSVNVSGKLSALSLHTGDGSIVYRVQPGAKMSEPWEISTGDGSVSLYLPSEFDADLDAHTGDGSIRSDLGIENPEKGGERRTLRAKVGNGGKLLRIRTGDGAIRLKMN
jgi:DUF4097 and DUF4098 domain-containing protein YvlB